MGNSLKQGKQPHFLCFLSSCTLLNFGCSDDLFQTWVSSSLMSHAAWCPLHHGWVLQSPLLSAEDEVVQASSSFLWCYIARPQMH